MGRTRAGAGGGMRASTTGIDVTPARGPGQCEGLLLTILLTILLIAAIHRRDFFTGERLEPLPSRPSRYHGPLVVKSVLVAAGMMALFFAGAPVPIAAIVGGALLLLTRSIKAVKVYLQIGWSLLLMFVGLFIVIAGVERAVLSPQAIAAMGRMHLASMPVLATVTAALSNLVSNVPAVLRSSTIHSAPGSWSRWPPRSPAISPWSDRSRTTDLIASSMYRAHSI